MENWFFGIPPMTEVAIGWLSGLASVGVVVFVLLASLAALYMLGAQSRLTRALSALVPSLRARVTGALVLVAAVPLISLALVLAERGAEQRLERLGDGLRAGAADLAAATSDLIDKHRSAGALNLSRFAELERRVRGLDARAIVVVDRQQRVIYASPVTGLEPPTVVDSALIGAARRVVPGQIFTYALARGAVVESFMGAGQGIANGWQVLLLTPTRTLKRALIAELIVSAAWLAAALLVAVCVALAMANGITRELRRLDAMLDEVQIDVVTEMPPPDPSTPREIALLHERIATAVGRMRTTYDHLTGSLDETERLRCELADALADQETEIRTRTEELRRSNMTLELLNRTDSLTGLANRQGFKEFLHQAWGLAIRERQSMALICIDIDHFKAYNDEYGHPAGDRCLQAVAGAVNGAARRPLDHVARNGGEEFVAVLGDTDLAAALKVAEDMRRVVERLRVRHRGSASGRWVTVSIGVAAARPEHGADPGRLLDSADRALYAAKDEGRNGVVYMTRGGPVPLGRHATRRASRRTSLEARLDPTPTPAPSSGDGNVIDLMIRD